MALIFNGNIPKTIKYIDNKNNFGLPSGYTRLKYIESTGTQYILTNILPSANYGKIVADVFLTQGATGEKSFIGVREGNNSGALECYFTNGKPSFWIRGNREGALTAGNTPVYNQKIHYEAIYSTEGMELTVTNVGNYSNSILYDKSNNREYMLFTYNRIGSNSYNFVGRIYNLELYDNERKIAHFVPCRKNDDNALGMYDIVNNEFYTNSGTGSFIAGEPIGTVSKLVYNGTTVWKEYTQLEYIESTGTQYIDTGIIPNQDTGVYIDFQILNPFNRTEKVVFGTRTGNNTNERWLYLSQYNGSAQSQTFSSGLVGFGKGWYHANLTINQRIQLSIINGVLTTPTGRTENVDTETFTSPYTLPLFASKHNSNTASKFSNVKLYSFKLYDGDILIRDFIPYKIDNEIGLLDVINNVFYTNQGTGSFIEGEMPK